MTLVAALNSPTDAVIVTDERVGYETGLPGLTSKVRIFPHLGAMWIVSGSAMLAHVFDIAASNLSTLDAMLTVGADRLASEWRRLIDKGHHPAAWSSDGTEGTVVLVSARVAGDTAGWFLKAPDFTAVRHPGYLFRMQPRPVFEFVEPTDVSELVDLAARVQAENDGDFGRELWATTLTDGVLGTRFVTECVHRASETPLEAANRHLAERVEDLRLAQAGLSG